MLEQEELCKNAIKKGRLKVVKRPVLIAIIGYIIGIIVGLYLQISIAPFCILIIVTDIIYKQFLKSKRKHQKLKLFSIKRYFNYNLSSNFT